MRLSLIPLFLLSFFTLFADEIEGNSDDDDDDDTSVSNLIILPAGTVHQGDFFAIGNSVEISGTVTGDVYALASQVVIDGTVNGDLLALGGTINVSGQIGNNVRIIAGQATISGEVGRNVTIAAANMSLISSGTILGNLVMAAGNAEVASSIGGDMTGGASNLRVSSTINRNVQAYVGHMRLTSRATIGGDLVYDSDQKASIEPEARVKGQIVYHPSFIKEIFHGRLLHLLMIGSKIAGVLMNFLYTFVIGWIWLRLYPQNLERAQNALSHKPLKALIYGVMLLVLLPLASLIFLMSILGAPFALTLLALNVIGFYTAKVLTIFWASNRLFKPLGLKPNTLTCFFIGMICYFVITAIPFFGSIVAFVAMLFGLGAVPLAKMHQKQIKA